MTLKEKFKQKKIYINPYNFKLTEEGAESFEKIADEFAIDFCEWVSINYFVYNTWEESKTTKEFLEIYKKEKGL
jgi:hypothetical protein